jgi:hypothetical protein
MHVGATVTEHRVGRRALDWTPACANEATCPWSEGSRQPTISTCTRLKSCRVETSPSRPAHTKLQRAAGAVQTVDRLAVAMEQMANAVADWCGEPSAIVQENALPPEACALRWHVQSIADDRG